MEDELRRVDIAWGTRKVNDLGGDAPGLQLKYMEPMLREMAKAENLSAQACLGVMMQTIGSITGGEAVVRYSAGDIDGYREAMATWCEIMIAGAAMMGSLLGYDRRQMLEQLLEMEKHAEPHRGR